MGERDKNLEEANSLLFLAVALLPLFRRKR